MCFWVQPVTRHAPGRTAVKRLCSWQDGGGQGCVNDAHIRTFSRVGCHLIQRKKKKKTWQAFAVWLWTFTSRDAHSGRGRPTTSDPLLPPPDVAR